MLAVDNKALVHRFVDEVQSGGDIGLIDEICSPEFVNHSARRGYPQTARGSRSSRICSEEPSPTPTSP